jgi:hypothetical protein
MSIGTTLLECTLTLKKKKKKQQKHPVGPENLTQRISSKYRKALHAKMLVAIASTAGG